MSSGARLVISKSSLRASNLSTMPMTTAESNRMLPIAAAFVRKLYRMLTVEDPAIVRWSIDGRSFSILDEEQFEAHVLPRYFRGCLGLFLQNLDEHAFSKTFKREESCVTVWYSHEHFVRGDPSRLSLVVRTQPAKRWRSRRRRPTVELKHTLGEVKQVKEEPQVLPDLSMLLDFTNTSMSVSTTAPRAETTMKSNEALVQMIAQHVVNPYSSSAAMLTSTEDCSLSNQHCTEATLFTREMMESMVAWLDTTA